MVVDSLSSSGDKYRECLLVKHNVCQPCSLCCRIVRPVSRDNRLACILSIVYRDALKCHRFSSWTTINKAPFDLLTWLIQLVELMTKALPTSSPDRCTPSRCRKSFCKSSSFDRLLEHHQILEARMEVKKLTPMHPKAQRPCGATDRL